MPHLLPNIKDLKRNELTAVMTALGEPAYRSSQLHRWLFSHHAKNFREMSSFSLSLREKLSSRYTIRSSILNDSLQETCENEGMGTTKLLIRMPDKEAVESVLIPAADRITACISTQIGCPLDCSFCATGKMGLKRNLSSGEIADQVYLLNGYLQNRYGKSKTITNVVFMGMGEPLLNMRNLLDAIETISNRSYRFSLPQRKITISTVGIVPQIRLLSSTLLKTKLAISLHAAIQKKRESLMPAARQWHLEALRKAILEYNRKTDNPVTIAYMLLDGINDTGKDITALKRFTAGLFCKINLIDYNPIVNIDLKPVHRGKRERFLQALLDSGLQATARKSHGSSINAACGQLALNQRQRAPEEPN